MQLLGNQTDIHQARMLMALGDVKNVVFHILLDGVPRLFAAVFLAANAQTFTLAERVVHQTLMFAHHLTVNAFDHTRLRG
ncbi:hypothetical protein D3C80_1857440 [compost metagenome]